MSTRADIAEVLTDSGLVAASEFRPSVLGAGNAWGQITGHDRREGLLATNWAVYVVLPAESQAAQVWYETNIAALWVALMRVMYVDSDQAVTIPVNNGDNLYAIELTGYSE